MHVAPVFKPIRSKYLVLTQNFFLPLLICLSVLALLYTLLYSSLFSITAVNCSLDFEPCRSPAVLSELDKLKGQNIFLLNKQRVEERLESGDFTIRQASLKRVLRGVVNVELESIYPVVALRVKDNVSWAVFGQELQLIATRSLDPNVPTLIVTTPVNLVVGQAPEDAAILHALQLARSLGDQLFTFKSLELIDQDTLELTLADGMTALFTPQKDEGEQLSALQAVLSEGTIKEGVRIIDVRFAQPVLRP